MASEVNIDINKEIVFGSPEPVVSRRISGLEKKGVLRKAMSRLQDFCSRIDALTFNGAYAFFERSNAFKELDEARLL